jgi:hypothetical protein
VNKELNPGWYLVKSRVWAGVVAFPPGRAPADVARTNLPAMGPVKRQSVVSVSGTWAFPTLGTPLVEKGSADGGSDRWRPAPYFGLQSFVSILRGTNPEGGGVRVGVVDVGTSAGHVAPTSWPSSQPPLFFVSTRTDDQVLSDPGSPLENVELIELPRVCPGDDLQLEIHLSTKKSGKSVASCAFHNVTQGQVIQRTTPIPYAMVGYAAAWGLGAAGSGWPVIPRFGILTMNGATFQTDAKVLEQKLGFAGLVPKKTSAISLLVEIDELVGVTTPSASSQGYQPVLVQFEYLGKSTPLGPHDRSDAAVATLYKEFQL